MAANGSGSGATAPCPCSETRVRLSCCSTGPRTSPTTSTAGTTPSRPRPADFPWPRGWSGPRPICSPAPGNSNRPTRTYGQRATANGARLSSSPASPPRSARSPWPRAGQNCSARCSATPAARCAPTCSPWPCWSRVEATWPWWTPAADRSIGDSGSPFARQCRWLRQPQVEPTTSGTRARTVPPRHSRDCAPGRPCRCASADARSGRSRSAGRNPSPSTTTMSVSSRPSPHSAPRRSTGSPAGRRNDGRHEPRAASPRVSSGPC